MEYLASSDISLSITEAGSNISPREGKAISPLTPIVSSNLLAPETPDLSPGRRRFLTCSVLCPVR